MNAPRWAMGLAIALVVSPAWAATGSEGVRVGLTLFAVALLVTSAKIGGLVVERCGQPAVLGELLVGKAAFGDWRTDAPLARRKITELPPPYGTRSASNPRDDAGNRSRRNRSPVSSSSSGLRCRIICLQNSANRLSCAGRSFLRKCSATSATTRSPIA